MTLKDGNMLPAKLWACKGRKRVELLWHNHWDVWIATSQHLSSSQHLMRGTCSKDDTAFTKTNKETKKSLKSPHCHNADPNLQSSLHQLYKILLYIFFLVNSLNTPLIRQSAKLPEVLNILFEEMGEIPKAIWRSMAVKKKKSLQIPTLPQCQTQSPLHIKTSFDTRTNRSKGQKWTQYRQYSWYRKQKSLQSLHCIATIPVSSSPHANSR